MDINIEKNKVYTDIKRNKFIIFLKPFYIPILIFLIFSLTILIGIWNVKSIEFSEENIKYSNINDLKSSTEKYIGKCIFWVDSMNMANDIYEVNKYVESVQVDKVIPSKVYIKLKEYIPKYIAYTNGRCNVYSNEGESILYICEDCAKDCSGYTIQYEDSIYISSEENLESNEKLIYIEELNSIEKILNIFGYQVSRVNMYESYIDIVDTKSHSFYFDIRSEFRTQLARMLLVGEEINNSKAKFNILDLRFERPVLKYKK